MHGVGYLSLIALSLSSPASNAACPSQEAVAAYVAAFVALRLSKGFGKNLTIDDAACAQARLVRALPQAAGPVVGYKAAFMSPEVQKRFGLSDPAWGVMFKNMMLDSGAKLPSINCPRRCESKPAGPDLQFKRGFVSCGVSLHRPRPPTGMSVLFPREMWCVSSRSLPAL